MSKMQQYVWSIASFELLSLIIWYSKSKRLTYKNDSKIWNLEQKKEMKKRVWNNSVHSNVHLIFFTLVTMIPTRSDHLAILFR